MEPAPAPSPLDSDPRSLLNTRFGLESFRAGQQQVIERLLAGRNVAAVFPTGGGKSLCYQLPSLCFSGTTVVVSPLIALMKDQCDALRDRGIPAVRLDSAMTPRQYRQAMHGVRNGDTKLMYVAPERFFNERFIASLGSLKISLFAIDEAHCISQWGHNFRPDYLKLGSVAKRFSAERILALTATATPSVLKDIQAAFSISDDDAIRTRFYRSNLHLRSVILDQQDQYAHLLDRIRSRRAGCTLIYVSTQATAEEIAERLTDDGIKATAYHAGLDTDTRVSIQNEFIASQKGIIVATIAFGMGIDKSNIRYVYHFNPPKSLEAYAQEIGRAGRDGKIAICEMMVVPEDRVVLDNFTYGDTPSRQNVLRMIEILSGHADEFHLSHYRISSESDIRLLVVRTLLTYLELEGYLEATSPRYDHYKLQPQVTSQTILDHFQGERRAFVSSLLSLLTKGRTWFTLNVTLATKRLATDRERIIKTIEYMNEQGWLVVKVSDLTHGYRWLRRVDDPAALADQLTTRMLEREKSDIQRLDQVFLLAEARDCQAATLSKHFGEKRTRACKHCSACLDEGPFDMPITAPRTLGRSARIAVQDMVAKYPDALATPRDQARFLCGLSSPVMMRSRLTREPHYGVCRDMPFADVLRELEGG
ncbi:RecQ family ATP-dependent DNA helicase [Novipirellula artificiosorum]|uniref:ATP-dependent DNA helicase RecQ n=1 Tax=Novipirellula artificiosorum TaxID=2528016 RepID=A0A5C6D6Q0_9BACT|nr:RecQ family ATP-dependent DNA helicase [Novipirellula artificiosorum]TWU30549.1 ATP-dependent DNA helicase RecQ [Novipirellula artificiosorum]